MHLTPLGELTALPDLLAGFKGVLLLRDEREGKEKEREGRGEGEREGRRLRSGCWGDGRPDKQKAIIRHDVTSTIIHTGVSS